MMCSFILFECLDVVFCDVRVWWYKTCRVKEGRFHRSPLLLGVSFGVLLGRTPRNPSTTAW